MRSDETAEGICKACQSPPLAGTGGCRLIPAVEMPSCLRETCRGRHPFCGQPLVSESILDTVAQIQLCFLLPLENRLCALLRYCLGSH